jgi:molecular chaperone DnaK
MKGEDVKSIKQATDRLTQAATKLGEAMNAAASNSAAAAGGSAQGGSAQGEADVVDAEFEEVDKRGRKAS